MTSNPPLKLVRHGQASGGDPVPDKVPWRPKVALILGGLLIALWVLWSFTAEQRAIRHMPEAERRALLDRTVANLRSICQSDEGLRDWCQGQANFALEFPECLRDCRALAGQVLSRVQSPR